MAAVCKTTQSQRHKTSQLHEQPEEALGSRKLAGYRYASK